MGADSEGSPKTDAKIARLSYRLTGAEFIGKSHGAARAFDDGRQVFIEFPTGIRRGEMPPLWVIGAEGGAELVNYRVEDNGHTTIYWSNCIECGTCRIICPFHNISWKYPAGGFGVSYRYG
jgi:NAD-dependent dihydropyrimidine dehydrogenase PreA subunit